MHVWYMGFLTCLQIFGTEVLPIGSDVLEGLVHVVPTISEVVSGKSEAPYTVHFLPILMEDGGHLEASSVLAGLC